MGADAVVVVVEMILSYYQSAASEGFVPAANDHVPMVGKHGVLIVVVVNWVVSG